MADRAAHAAIVHLEDLLFRLNYQAVVYAYLAELILDDGYALAVLCGKDVVHYGRTSGRRRRSQDRNLALEEEIRTIRTDQDSRPDWRIFFRLKRYPMPHQLES